MLELKELRSRPLTHTTLIAFALVSVCFSLDKFCCSAVVLCYATLQPSSKQLHSKGHSQSETTTVSERQGLSAVYSCLQRYLLVVEGMDCFVCRVSVKEQNERNAFAFSCYLVFYHSRPGWEERAV